MPDIPVSALDTRQQKLFENARTALELGNLDYALEACAQVLRSAPGCVTVRRLHRVAQMRRFQHRNRIVAKAMGGLSSTPFIFSSATKNPLKALGSAEKILAVDPTSTSALKLLGDAALGLGLPETAAFAREAVQELDPEDEENLNALGEAWLAAGKPEEALRVADQWLNWKPSHAPAQDLMRKAAISKTMGAEGWRPREEKGADPVAPATVEVPEALPTEEEQLEAVRKDLAAVLSRVVEEPDHLEHYRDIVAGCTRLGRIEEALSWVRRARQRPAGATDSAFERQESELGAALLEQHVKTAESALIASPGDPEVQARVAAAKRELASFRLYEAKRQVELNPNDHGTRLALGMQLFEGGQFEAAIAQFQLAIKEPTVRLQALIGLGRSFKARKLNDLAAAQFVLAKAAMIPMNDQKKQVVYQLGECYELLGQRAEAIAEFKAIYAEDIGYRDVAARINAYYANTGSRSPSG